jgi:cobalt/nickel transport system permease protein
VSLTGQKAVNGYGPLAVGGAGRFFSRASRSLPRHFPFQDNFTEKYIGTVMHIMEGYLPATHCIGWGLASAPFVALGIYKVRRTMKEHPQTKLLLGAAGAYSFVLSALKLPSVTGSCSHPTGIGLGAMLFGPRAMTVLGAIVLIFQALLVGHGGLTTLGANVFSMAIVGSYVAYVLYRLGCRLNLPVWLSVFVAATVSDWATYLTTSFQLAYAFPDPLTGSITSSAVKFMGIYSITQIPLAICEGLLTVVVMRMLTSYSRGELDELAVLPKRGGQ